MKKENVIRCEWVGNYPLYILYHDTEWGVPEHDDRKLFEMLILEGAQAGLSWATILKKRKTYQDAFDNFNPQKIAQYDAKRVQELLINPGIIRNRLKIESTVHNAKAFLKIHEEFGSFNAYIWAFVGGEPIIHNYKSLTQIPSKTVEAEAMSQDLLKRGFKFVGPTICYAFMQAVGMVNDHVISCFRYTELK